MYKSGTILTLKKPHKPDPETKEPFPYNEVEVIGPSPISHLVKGDWTGADAAGVLLTGLTNFGATLDEPFGWLRTLYDVKTIPDEKKSETVHKDQAAILAAAHNVPETPEEVFAAKAPGIPPKEGETRARTPMSPLGEPVNEAAKSVLSE